MVKRLRTFRINVGGRIGARKARRLSPSRRKFKRVRGSFVDLGRWPTRFFVFSEVILGTRLFTVTELQTGLRVGLGDSEADALHHAATTIYARTNFGDPKILMRAVRRQAKRLGRANPLTRVRA